MADTGGNLLLNSIGTRDAAEVKSVLKGSYPVMANIDWSCPNSQDAYTPPGNQPKTKSLEDELAESLAGGVGLVVLPRKKGLITEKTSTEMSLL